MNRQQLKRESENLTVGQTIAVTRIDPQPHYHGLPAIKTLRGEYLGATDKHLIVRHNDLEIRHFHTAITNVSVCSSHLLSAAETTNKGVK